MGAFLFQLTHGRAMTARCFFVLLAATAVLHSAYAELIFSIRYHDKNIYYPGDRVELRLTLSNSGGIDAREESFYLADDPRQSFGFDLRSLTGDPVPLSEGYASSLSAGGAYRVVNLAPGQELSVTAVLNDWVNPDTPEQYRLTGFFYPRLRSPRSGALQASSVLDLTVIPDSGDRRREQLGSDVAAALRNRNLDPWNVVRETLESRSESRFNRALLYLDIESLAETIAGGGDAESLKRALIRGEWRDIPGLRFPAVEWKLLSSRVYPSEAAVRLRAVYEPYGERFERDLRFYLHKDAGYWAVRRIESAAGDDPDPEVYGALDLNPPEVVSELIRAVTRGDWDIALRYYDIDELVRGLPEYSERWKDMSAAEHLLALNDYRERLISNRLDDRRRPLADIEQWRITGVNYTDVTGSVVVENTRVFTTPEGSFDELSTYTFRLRRTGGADDRWIVSRYDTLLLGE